MLTLYLLFPRGILGNHYNGNYDPIWDIDAEIETLNATKGWQIGIHVDAASTFH